MRRTTANDQWQPALLARQLGRLTPVLLAALTLGACANSAKLDPQFSVAENRSAGDPSKPTQTELEKALEYWGKENAKAPRDLKPALNYAKNLKVAGQKDQALAVLQSASVYHSTSRELASEYGRLALEMDQTSLAQRLLDMADDPAKPDWRIVSARGTAFAKQGQYGPAIAQFERALQLSPDQTSVTSNLAMAHAASGDARKAEEILRRIASRPDAEPKIRQNLALVLSLQGKYDEARAISAKDMPSETASANVEYVRQMVRVAPQTSPGPAIGPGVWSTNVATGSIVPRAGASTNASSPSSLLKPSQR